MNRREKLLVALIVSVLAGAVLYLAVSRLYLQPLRDMGKKADELRTEIATLEKSNSMRGEYVRQLTDLALKAYDADERKASADAQARLMALSERSGLRQGTTSVGPIAAREKAGTYKEIGWQLSGTGKLDAVVNLLYLLEKEPYLQRVDTVSITPQVRTNEATLNLRYTTLVPAPSIAKLAAQRRPATGPSATQPVEHSLNTQERLAYNGIQDRDLFRPYVQRPPEPPPAPVAVTPPEQPAPRPAAPTPQGPRGPGIERYRVVGLPAFGPRPDQVEIYISDASRGGQTLPFKVGDELEGHKIVMVDYRPLPSRREPELLSPSRVILKNGPDYLAVELGDTLADKRPMGPAELPDALRPAATQAAATPADLADRGPPKSSGPEAARVR